MSGKDIFVVAFSNDRTRDAWHHLYRALFKMQAARFDSRNWVWYFPNGDQVWLVVFQTDSDSRKIVGHHFVGYAIEDQIPTECAMTLDRLTHPLS